MRRIEWVKQRLENWALWKEREGRGGLGYYTASSFLRVAVDCGNQADPLLSTVDEIEAQKTDEAVNSLQGTKPHLHRTLVLIYLKDTGIRRAALEMCKAESTIKANLAHADHAIELWLRAKAEEKDKQQAAAAKRPGGFTA